MSTAQRVALAAGVALIILLVLFPPWRLVISGSAFAGAVEYSSSPAGYHFLFRSKAEWENLTPQVYPKRDPRLPPPVYHKLELDGFRLAVGLLGVAVCTALTILFIDVRARE